MEKLMKRLIVIEGFDRSGKDTLMKDLFDMNLPNTYIYFNDLEGLPKYDKEQGDFLVWLNNFIYTQINTINELFDKYDTVIMTRLLISDEVYSLLFNREHTCIKYIDNLRKDVTIYNYCMLFNDYEEYINRLKIIKDDNIQYDEHVFNKINLIYTDIIESINKVTYIINMIGYIFHIFSWTGRDEVLNNFLTLYNYDKR